MTEPGILRLGEHRPEPDGTRPLVLGRALASLSPAFLDPSDQPVQCWIAKVAALEMLDPPAFCQQTIEPGRHYLIHTETDAGFHTLPLRRAYCAPCAIREWAFWDVHEAPAAAS